ncbi:MAG: DUF1844 domain-containing protein [Candidatus Krumholzibacteriia bacterium]
MNDEGMSRHDEVLLGLALTLKHATMQHLGKFKNPVTDQVERDLDQARGTIDILEMLKAKCRTDTPADLLRLLDAAVLELQMNYLDERRRDRREHAGEEAAAGGSGVGNAAAGPAEPSDSPPADASDSPSADGSDSPSADASDSPSPDTTEGSAAAGTGAEDDETT